MKGALALIDFWREVTRSKPFRVLRPTFTRRGKLRVLAWIFFPRQLQPWRILHLGSCQLTALTVMSSTLLPFLYQTRTIQRAWRCRTAVSFVRLAHANRGPTEKKKTEAVPFDWGGEEPPEEYRGGKKFYGDMSHEAMRGDKRNTLSPTEAQVFKRIFDEIAEGKMPAARPSRRRREEEQADHSPWLTGQPRSLVEHARMSEFREKYLSRSPTSLRNAANKALGMFELAPSEEAIEQMSEEDKKAWAERLRYRKMREDEKRRVEGLMRDCRTDFALWEVMQKEVFSLPEKLGLRPKSKASAPKRRRAKAAKEPKEEEQLAEQNAADETKTPEASVSTVGKEEGEKVIMDVQGALYSAYLIHGLQLFDTGFTRPSPFAFQILPHVKSLGLESYVLGVSTPFYATLAGLHWDRFGDATSALDVIQEMSSTGLYVNQEVIALLGRIREHLTSCTLGLQGPFVSAMMEAPPYDGALMHRIDQIERFERDPVRGQPGE